jgi:hypothetical protein
MTEQEKQEFQALKEQVKKQGEYIARKQKEEQTAYVAKKAVELGIPKWRVREGFALKNKATEQEITDYLTKVKSNLPQEQADITSEETKAIADSLVKGMGCISGLGR